MKNKVLNIITRIQELAIREHRKCEDPYYSCPKAENGEFAAPTKGKNCDCGVDEHNHEVGELIKILMEWLLPAHEMETLLLARVDVVKGPDGAEINMVTDEGETIQGKAETVEQAMFELAESFRQWVEVKAEHAVQLEKPQEARNEP